MRHLKLQGIATVPGSKCVVSNAAIGFSKKIDEIARLDSGCANRV